MLIDATVHLPVSLAMLDGIFKAPDAQELMRISFRWLHFLAGITWIGLLYFFNLVNVNFMKALDAPTKKIVVPNLMPKALWYFRWGAVVTVLAGSSTSRNRASARSAPSPSGVIDPHGNSSGSSASARAPRSSRGAARDRLGGAAFRRPRSLGEIRGAIESGRRVALRRDRRTPCERARR
jgi:hypothetical protein